MRTTWDIFQEMDALRREVDRALREAGVGRPVFSPISGVSFLPGRSARGYPLINVSEDQDAYAVEALAPGIDPGTVQVSVLADSVTLSGEKKAADGQVGADAYHRTERSAGRFVRQVTLPGQVDPGKVAASYTNGILRVVLPKSEAAKPREISVRVG